MPAENEGISLESISMFKAFSCIFYTCIGSISIHMNVPNEKRFEAPDTSVIAINTFLVQNYSLEAS